MEDKSDISVFVLGIWNCNLIFRKSVNCNHVNYPKCEIGVIKFQNNQFKHCKLAHDDVEVLCDLEDRIFGQLSRVYFSEVSDLYFTCSVLILETSLFFLLTFFLEILYSILYKLKHFIPRCSLW